MQYMLLIYSDDAAGAVTAMSEAEQAAVTGEYMAIAQEAGVSGGARLQPAETATTVRAQDGRNVHHRRAVRGDQGGTRRVLPVRGGRPRRRDRHRRTHPRGPSRRRGRGTPGGAALIEQLFRSEWGRVVAGLIRLPGDFDLAEEAAQEAFAAALPPGRKGTRQPTRLADRAAAASASIGSAATASAARTASRAASRRPRPGRRPPNATDGLSRRPLRLIFTCCHPALKPGGAGGADAAHRWAG